MRPARWIGDCRFEPDLNRLVRADGTVAKLEPRVADLLVFFSERPRQVLAKDEILAKVWPVAHVSDDALVYAVSELRKALDDDARNPTFIQTVPRRGYRLIAPVTGLADAAADNAEIETVARRPPVAPQPRPGMALRGSFFSTARAVLAIVGATVVVLAARSWIDGGEPRTSAISFANATALPFTAYDGMEFEPSLSPSGDRVAFAWNPTGTTNIYVRLLSGGDAVRLTDREADDRSPVWSPDGLSVAFVRGRGTFPGVYVVSALGGSERLLFELREERLEARQGGGWLSWSPDGRLIAYSEPSVPRVIRLFDLETGDSHSLTEPPSNFVGDSEPRFSPDGGSVAFVRARGLFDRDLHLIDINDRITTRITHDNRWIYGHTWDPSGEQIVYSSDRGSGAVSLWAVSLAGEQPRRIEAAGSAAFHPDISRDGRVLVYADGLRDVDIWEVQLADGETATGASKIIDSTRFDAAPAFSPDGTRIAFVSTRSGTQTVWVCEFDCRNAFPLLGESIQSDSPSWSPDGRSIVASARINEDNDVVAVRVASREQQRITEDPANDAFPSWSADGEAIYFASDRSGDHQVYRVPVQGGVATRVTADGGLRARESPDGRFLYFDRYDRRGVWQARMPGGEPELVIAEVVGGTWTVSRSGLWTFNGSRLHSHELGQSPRAVNLPRNFAGAALPGFAQVFDVSGDGDRALVIEGLVQMDLAVLDLSR